MPTLNQATGVTADPQRHPLTLEDFGKIGQDQRLSLVRGITPITGGNYLRFTAFDSERSRFAGTRDKPAGIPDATSFAFDSFIVQRVNRDDDELFMINYTNGDPIIDVFHRHPTMLSIQGIIPDTAPFYANDREQGVVHGYVGESLEVLRTLYEQRFRASSALGQTSEVRGYVDFVHKNRRDIGFLIRMITERTGAQLDHATFTVDMVVLRSQFLDLRLPPLASAGLVENTPDIAASLEGFGTL